MLAVVRSLLLPIFTASNSPFASLCFALLCFGGWGGVGSGEQQPRRIKQLRCGIERSTRDCIISRELIRGSNYCISTLWVAEIRVTAFCLSQGAHFVSLDDVRIRSNESFEQEIRFVFERNQPRTSVLKFTSLCDLPKLLEQEETPLCTMTTVWQLRLISELLVRANRLTRRKDGTMNRWLADYFELKVPANAKPEHGVSTIDVTFDKEAGVWARLFIPTQEMEVTPLQVASDGTQTEFNKKLPIIIYYHGGGFALMCPDVLIYDKFCRRLAKSCNAIVISVHYRRAPEHKFPVAYDDSYKALEWLQSDDSTSSLPPNVDFSRVFLSGDSAGANIAHHVALRASGQDLGRVRLKGLVLIQSFFGGEERTPAELRLKNVPIVTTENLDWHWMAFLPEGSNRDHPACNIFGRNSPDLSQVAFPPVVNIIGGLDILQDWEFRYSEGMKKAGKEVQTIFYEEGVHTFALLNQVKVTFQMFADVATFIDGH